MLELEVNNEYKYFRDKNDLFDWLYEGGYKHYEPEKEFDVLFERVLYYTREIPYEEYFELMLEEFERDYKLTIYDEWGGDFYIDHIIKTIKNIVWYNGTYADIEFDLELFTEGNIIVKLTYDRLETPFVVLLYNKGIEFSENRLHLLDSLCDLINDTIERVVRK